jgi:hypothetical protein
MKASIITVPSVVCVLCFESAREMISTGGSVPGASSQQFDDIWTCKAYLQNLRRYHCSKVWPRMSVYAYPTESSMNLAALT